MDGSAENILHQVQKGASESNKQILASDGNLQVRVQLADWDRLGCLLEKLEIRPAARSSLNIDPLWIEKEINYLGEPLKIIELEKHRGKALLRSFPPRRGNGTVHFFEMVIDRREGLSFNRLSYDRSLGCRTQTPVPLTRETLERLLADLVNLASRN
ncbi:MAG: hypothetical protein HXY45_17585 [Syntrophaceae bacterium]|nr:hypothetical protein [Syntrophaceae bacterium]